jgi:hypothetical protein
MPTKKDYEKICKEQEQELSVQHTAGRSARRARRRTAEEVKRARRRAVRQAENALLESIADFVEWHDDGGTSLADAIREEFE